MADSRRLLNGLEDYRRSLERHLGKLENEFQSLDSAWRRFSSVYQGDAAEQFRANWSRTAQNFNDYIQATNNIIRLLDERIEALQTANRTEGGMEL